MGVAVFSTPEKQKDYTTELLRIAFSREVSDGASTLFSAFLTVYKPSDIVALSSAGDELEDCGLSLVNNGGENFIYEWVDQERTYYTYRITAFDSDKYYFGVSHVKKAHASMDDCLNDGYFGSGGQKQGNKFVNWKKAHKNTLQKEVLKIFDRAAHAYSCEKELVGDLWKTDPNCLNSCQGGKSGGALIRTGQFKEEICPKHGLSKHKNGHCAKCWVGSSISLKICPIHGETKFRKNRCLKCINRKNVSLKICPIHGETTHQGNSCCKCSAQKYLTEGLCPVHGKTVFRKNVCQSCFNESHISIKVCPKHGETKFNGDSCMKCSSATTKEMCPTHGLTDHRGNACLKCVAQKSLTVKRCLIHGDVQHRGDLCLTCHNEKNISLRICPIHGKTKHQGNSCCQCSNASPISMKICPIHGESKHRGKSCCKCASARRKDRKKT